MLILFRHNAKKFAYDTASGSLTQLSALTWRMLEAVRPPLGPICPTALRYELAKYDSDDVEKAYETIYQRFTDGMLFASESGVLTPPDTDEETARAALLAAAEHLTEPITVAGNHEVLAREILNAKGLLKT